MIKKSKFIIVSYIIISFLFWYSIGLPVMKGEIDFKFYSDSKTYETLALATDDVTTLVRVSGNQVGPVLISKYMGPLNYTGMFLLQLLVFLVSIRMMLKDLNVKKSSFLILLFINPVTFSSLFAINKEIFSFLTLACTIRFLERGTYKWMLYAFILSLIVRWQLSLFLIIITLTFSPINFLHKRKWLYIILFLLGISMVLYVTRDTLLGQVFTKYEANILENSTKGSTGLFDRIMIIQDEYGYIFAFIPKLLHLMVGMTTRFLHVLNPDPVEMYNDVVLYWMGPINLFLLFTIFRKRLFSLNEPYIFISLIYAGIFAITPIYNIRYFYPVGIFLSIVVCRKKVYDKMVIKKAGLRLFSK